MEQLLAVELANGLNPTVQRQLMRLFSRALVGDTGQFDIITGRRSYESPDGNRHSFVEI